MLLIQEHLRFRDRSAAGADPPTEATACFVAAARQVQPVIQQQGTPEEIRAVTRPPAGSLGARAGLLIVDRDQRILLADGDALRNLHAGGLVGRRLADVVPAAEWEVLEPRYLAALDGHEQSVEYRAPGESGVHLLRVAPLCDDAAVVGAMVLAQDITAEVGSSRQLAESERSQHSVLEVLDEGVIVVDLQGRLEQANRAACAILGLDLAAARADPAWWEAFGARRPGAEPTLDAGEIVARTGRGIREVDVEVTRADGAHLLLSVNYQPLRAGGGAVTGLVLSFRDITERERQREFLQATLDSLSAHIAVLDEHGEIVLTNRAWVQADAAPPKLGENYLAACDGAVGDEWAARKAAGLRAVMSGEQADFALEYPSQGPPAERWLRLGAARFEGPGDASVVVAHDDVTSRRQAEAQVTTQAALLEEVDVAVVATDLDGRITHWNRGAEQLHGWSHAEVVGRDVAELSRRTPAHWSPDSAGAVTGRASTPSPTRTGRRSPPTCAAG